MSFASKTRMCLTQVSLAHRRLIASPGDFASIVTLHGKLLDVASHELSVSPRRLTLDDARQHAISRGGVCLANSYKNNREHLEWRCQQSHTWFATFASVRRGAWCPTCRLPRLHGQNLKTELPNIKPGPKRVCYPCRGMEVARALAQSRGGVCLSERYVNSKTQMLWCCANGHKWYARYDRVRQGAWCPLCALKPLRHSIEFAFAVANSRGGQCLSTKYTNNYEHLEWRCAEGHAWQSTFRSVLRGSWCRRCDVNGRRLGLGHMRELAASRGGACISDAYVNSHTSLEWECKLGHSWFAPYNNIRRGSWCPQCACGKSERSIRVIFETIFLGRTFTNCWPEFLRGNHGRLQLDGYCDDLKLAFEYQGQQHYRVCEFFHRGSREKFEAQVSRDALKVTLCQAAEVKLVVVPCDVKDYWCFVRTYLLRWFSVNTIFATALPP
eukprot:TRINITY_DN30405_c0_g1_i2.p1 TRINITY_DN30405_c0_g1~~TRINITY_DN30405_c0_g1_i2.p1  ORF type:complete len:440 (-),score=28.07 TRINITY_DN30405_c0_g1_i2:91-1410(-)